MASSDESGMPVGNRPLYHRIAQEAEIPAEYSTRYPAKALAVKLSKGAAIPLPAIGDTFPSHNAFRIISMAHALQNNWLVHPQPHLAKSSAKTMRCSRSHSCWDNRVTGKCQFKLKAVLKGDVYEVTEAVYEHTHAFDGLFASQSPFLNRRAASNDHETDAESTSDEEDEDSEHGSVENGAAGAKRARSEKIIVNTKGSNVAGLMLPPPKRSSHAANASTSGSGSKGTVATQYSVGSSSQRRIPPSSSTSTIAPRSSNSIPAAPRPWPVELARLVTVMNKALLPKSHIFAAIFIKAGVVNRHEFSKLIWTFAAPTMQDQRMQWFIRRLRRERNGVALLTHVEVVQFRSGVKRVYDEIIPKQTQ